MWEEEKWWSIDIFTIQFVPAVEVGRDRPQKTKHTHIRNKKRQDRTIADREI